MFRIRRHRNEKPCRSIVRRIVFDASLINDANGILRESPTTNLCVEAIIRLEPARRYFNARSKGWISRTSR
jgi:hypothetical protein